MNTSILGPISMAKKPTRAEVHGETISMSPEDRAGPTEAPAKLANPIKKNADALDACGLGIVPWRNDLGGYTYLLKPPYPIPWNTNWPLERCCRRPQH